MSMGLHVPDGGAMLDGLAGGRRRVPARDR